MQRKRRKSKCRQIFFRPNTWFDLRCHTSVDYERLADLELLRVELQAAIKRLSPSQQKVLQMRFPFDDIPMSAYEISRAIRIAPSRAFSIEAIALARLKRNIRIKRFLE